MDPWSRVLPMVHCDSKEGASLTASAIKSVRTALDVPERELKRWRRIFDANAKVVEGEKCVYCPYVLNYGVTWVTIVF